MLAGNQQATAIRADVAEPENILEYSEVRRLLDPERPLGLLLVSVLHYVLDDDVAFRAAGWLRGLLAPGSYMVLAHPTFVEFAGKLASPEAGRSILSKASATKRRTRDQILAFFGDWVLVEPGLVLTPLWRPEGPDDVLVDDPERGFSLSGVAYRPEGSG
jgi:hypothetical protein